MADYGFRISQSGFDVKTTGDINLALTSKQNSFKIPTTLQGSTTLSLPFGLASTKTIAHNLGYIPTYEAWFADENNVWHTAFERTNLGANRDISANVILNTQYADSTNIYITLRNDSASSNRTGTIYYIVFLEAAA